MNMQIIVLYQRVVRYVKQALIDYRYDLKPGSASRTNQSFDQASQQTGIDSRGKNMHFLNLS